MLRLAIALSLVYACTSQTSETVSPVIEEKNVLSPPYFNIASGKKIDTTATCGTEGPELFCKLTGGTNFEYSDSLHQGQVCDVCDDNSRDKKHPVNNAIDGTEKWWQSPPLSRGSDFNRVNLTIHLGQVFHVAYVLIKFANSPRAGTWVLERSSDNGKTFQPWQYFANTDSDCYNLFGMGSLEEITRDDSVICTSDYSGVVPLENGEVIVSMIKGRPGASNFSHATILQEWSKATDIRLRFLRTKTLLGHLMAVSEQDPTVTRRYYYSIKDISIGGRCVCNGHADTCLPDAEDQYKLKCHCQHNTCGDSCEYCCPGFVQKAWRVAVPESTNECEACNCHGHSNECEYDADVARRRLSLDLSGNYEGGGVCLNCLHNTAGINCERCASGYWRPDDVDPRDPNGCRACDCDSSFTVGSCEPNTGRCYCKVQYAGDRCDRCAPGYYDFPECRACDCYYNGTLNDVCLPVGDACPCKYNFAGRFCDECAAGFYNFPQCDACECNGEGVASDICDPYSGSCPCADGFAGEHCDQCAPGYFQYPLCQRCPCSNVGTTDEVCNPETGECYCGDKYSGRSCDDCKPGFFGFPQCQECTCTEPGSLDNVCDSRTGVCTCKANYQGDACDSCAREYYGYPNCVACSCNVDGSLKTTCDELTGQCLCKDNIGGRTCDQCNPDYFNFPRCEECSCDARGITSVVPGVCLAFTSGQCDCKENVIGRNCDMCKPLHYDINRGCISCNCFIQGTLDGVGECDREDGQCWCKPYTCSQRCSECEDGFYGLEELNYLGCSSCECDVGGAMTSYCDKNTGQCTCKKNIEGRKCDRVVPGYYYPTLYQNQYEMEDGRSAQNTAVRAGYSDFVFPHYSMNGYAKYSVVQNEVKVSVVVHNSGLYRLLFRYVNTNNATLSGNVTVIPDGAGDQQSHSVTFSVTSLPQMVTVSTPFVLDKGTWTVVLEAGSGLLADYLVLLPSEYYEPGILELSVTVPCIPSLQQTKEECVMYTHPNLAPYTTEDLVADAPHDRKSSPNTALPEMLVLDGRSGINDNSQFTSTIDLPRAGKYVLVMEYASTASKFQKTSLSVTDGAGNTYNDAKFNIYTCPYSFMCRQVALGVLNDVAVFDMSLPVMKVNVQTETGGMLFVKSLTAIPYDQWSMEMVEPKPMCITTRGPAFEECLPSSYDIPFGSSRFNVPEESTINGAGVPGSVPQPPVVNDQDSEIGFLDGSDPSHRTLRIPMNLTPGRYVFVVQYYNPNFTSFNPDVVIDSGVASTGSANISYCPNADGCRAVVTTDEGNSVIDVTVPTTTFTMVVPDDKSFWVQYVLAIPEASYNPSLLRVEPVDKSGDFLRECGSDLQQSFYNTVKDPSDFCRDNIFSLTVDYNNGGLPCNCSGAGTIGGGDALCQEYGGQCPCRPNVIGRQCERCATGFYGYPDCQPCDCNGLMCDDVSGECICPPNTVKPACDRCAPFTHSFNPVAGCVDCDCNTEGVVNVTDIACNPENGQCRCKDHVTGQRCDRCEPGYFGFPECRMCTCDERGSNSDGCDPVTGQCLCKENVEGLQCSRCKKGTFHLDINNPEGCTECFCFGASTNTECTSSQFPMVEISNMEGWRLLNLVEQSPLVEVSNSGRSIQVNINDNGGPQQPSKPNLYWAAPKSYVGDRVGSYGGDLRYIATWEFAGRGDAAGDSASAPAPILGVLPDVILKGGQFEIGWVNPNHKENNVQLELSERNFKHLPSGNVVSRQEMMMVLADLQAIHIRASPVIGVDVVRLQDVVLTTTDYNRPAGSGPSIPSVEECACPEGYHGHSCQLCDPGYYRNKSRGLYLGYCEKCDCYGHCLTCDDYGQVIAPNKDCLHNTGGDKCDVCIDGFIGNATSGNVEACQPCPCPFPVEDGNFADTCEHDEDGSVICHCQEGYTGERCELCASGYFGNPAVYGGYCQKCNCHGNLDPNLIMPVCDPLTGVCNDCAFNTGGKYCERCADGFYGDAIIARNCTSCECNSCGTEVCDHMMGHCSCLPHVLGEFCNTCEPGYFGFDSCNGCRDCDCAVGALGSECDISTGQCQCAPNIVGVRCDKCAPGYWDYSSSGCRPCNCRNNGRCNPANGQCECPPGITGAQCDECELSRHVLLDGATECTLCGPCTDALLDDVEPMTHVVRSTIHHLKNISIAVIATRQIEELQKRVDEMLANLPDNDLISTTVHNLINESLADLTSEVSGSGAADDVSGGDPNSLKFYNNLEARIQKIEDEVAKMCNHTKILHHLVEATENATKGALVNATSTNRTVTEFYDDIKDLLEKLNAESSGDNEDYYEKLRNAQMMLQKMKERNFTGMMNIAEEELDMAKDLLRRVQENFTEPADNMKARVDNLTSQLNETRNKLHDLRDKLNNATKNINDANTANAVNSKNLTESRKIIDDINADSTMANETLNDAEQLLAAAKSAVDGPITNGVNELDQLADALQTAYNDLLPVYNNLTAGLERYSPYYNLSMEKVAQLHDDVAALNAITGSDLTDQVRIINAYRSIVNAIDEADKAADKAQMDAKKAFMDVASHNFQQQAEEAEKRSSDLLTRSQDLQSNNISALENVMSDLSDNLFKLEGEKGELQNNLTSINDRINDILNQDGLSDRLATTGSYINETNRIAEEILNRTRALEKQIQNAPTEGTDLSRKLAEVQGILDSIPPSLRRVKNQANVLRNRSEQLSRLHAANNIPKQIIDIKKRIELTRQIANVVKASMRFHKVEGKPTEYVQLRTPVQAVQDIGHYIEAKFKVNFVEDPSQNQLLFIGDTNRPDTDFLNVDTNGNNLRYVFKVGDGTGVINSRIALVPGSWYTVIISRWGNKGKMIIYYPIAGGRGDSGGTVTTGKEVLDAITNGTDMVANFNNTNMSFFIGGYPLQPPPTYIANPNVGDVCVSDVNLNNETVGVWNFINYNGSQPGKSCSVDSGFSNLPSDDAWRFRGEGSYLRIARADTMFLNNPSSVSHFIGFEIETLQDNSLLFLVGESIDQFIALQIVQGRFMLSWNYGFKNGPESAFVSGVDDVTKESDSTLIKAGLSPRFNLTLMAIGYKLRLQKKFTEGTPNITGDIWLGGIWKSDINPELKSYLVNLGTSFRGCLKVLQFNGRVFKVDDALENIGVTRGCRKESVRSLRVEGQDNVGVSTTLAAESGLEGGVTISSTTPTGTIMSVADDQGSANRNNEESRSTTSGPPETDESLPEDDYIEDALMADAPPGGGDSPANRSMLSMVLLVIGVVVGVVLVGAVVSSVYKTVFGAPAGGQPPVIVDEQTPLNDVQPQRTAQMDW